MPKVKPVPKGYHTVTSGLSVQGADAFIKFCKKVFGAKEVMRMPGPGGGVMHAEILIGDTHIMVGDEVPTMNNKSAKTLGSTPVTLHIYTPDCDALFKKAVANGATAVMPCADMFWGDRYGRFNDPFGNSWAVATHIEDVTPAEMKKRGKAFFKQMASQQPPAAE